MGELNDLVEHINKVFNVISPKNVRIEGLSGDEIDEVKGLLQKYSDRRSPRIYSFSLEVGVKRGGGQDSYTLVVGEAC